MVLIDGSPNITGGADRRFGGSATRGAAIASAASGGSEDSDGEKSPSRSARSHVVLCWRAEQVAVCVRLRFVSIERPRSDSRSWAFRRLSASVASVDAGPAEAEAEAAATLS